MAEVRLGLAPFMGLDLYNHTGLMKEGYSPDCCNVETDSGILSSTTGFSRISDKDGCLRFHNHYKSDGSIVRLCFRNGNIENFDNGTIYKSEYYNSEDVLSLVNYQMNDTYITVICNGKNVPLMFDGERISELGGQPPVASFVELHNERVFMAGNEGNPDRVYYSESFNPQSWNVEIESGYIDLPSWDGGRIKEIKSIFGDLVVFKDYGLYRIYGTYPGEFGVEKISSRVGCISRDTIAVSGENCFFINNQGLCVYNGLSAKPIENRQLKAVFDKVDFNRISCARLYDYDGKLYMYLPMEEDCLIIYDYSSGIILRQKGFEVRQFFSDDKGLYIVDGAGRVCIFDEEETFDNEKIQCYWKSREYDLGNKSEMKNILSFGVSAKGKGKVQIKVCTDRDSCVRTLNLSEKYDYYRVNTRIRGRYLTVEINNIDGSNFKLDSPILYIDVEEE